MLNRTRAADVIDTFAALGKAAETRISNILIQIKSERGNPTAIGLILIRARGLSHVIISICAHLGVIDVLVHNEVLGAGIRRAFVLQAAVHGLDAVCLLAALLVLTDTQDVAGLGAGCDVPAGGLHHLVEVGVGAVPRARGEAVHPVLVGGRGGSGAACGDEAEEGEEEEDGVAHGGCNCQE